MGFLPHIPFLFPRHLVTLIHHAMAAVTEGSYTVIMGFKAPPLAVPQLIAMGSHHRAILRSTGLTRAITDDLE